MDSGTDFGAASGQYRHELVVHCYRMLGSADEAEDVAQEALIRAWQARDRYDPARASVRTWLYRIATNACLTALEGRARRPLPSGLGAASNDPDTPLVPDFTVPWLQPLPDAYLRRDHADPQARAAERDSVRLALVAAMQLLPARQRAVLVLRDVLQFSAAEVAEQLDTSPTAVNSALQRARAALAEASPQEGTLRKAGDRAVRETVERYIHAFEAADVNTLVTLLTDDAVLEMPPVPLWYAGRADYGRFIARVFRARRRRLANGSRWGERPARPRGLLSRRRRCPATPHAAGAHGDRARDQAQRGVPGPAGIRAFRARSSPQALITLRKYVADSA